MMNYTLIEYRRQLDVIRVNNQASQKKLNKLVLIVTGTMFTIISSCFILHFMNVISLTN